MFDILSVLTFEKTMEISQISIAKIGLKSADPSFDDYKGVGAKLREAFSKLGFVYIKDHGIEDATIQKYMFG